MKKHLLALPVVLLILAVTAFGVFAEPETPTATIVITGGSLSVDANDIAFTGVTLDGEDTTAHSDFATNTWIATDPTGTGAGWHLTISSEDFFKEGDVTKYIDISESDQLFMIQLEGTHISYTDGNNPPVTDVPDLASIPDTGTTSLKFLTASAGEGMGKYTFQPNFSLGIPAETYEGTYTATVTVTIVSGPGS